MDQNTVLTSPTTLLQDFFKQVEKHVHVINDNKIGLVHQIAAVSAEIKRYDEIITANKFYPFEHGQEQYLALLPPLHDRLEHLKMALAGYLTRMDPGFLSLTQKSTRFPLFMILNIKSSRGSGILYRGRGRIDSPVVEFVPYLPKIISDQFAGVVNELASRANGRRDEISIHANYQGIMPDRVRYTIQKAEASKLFNEIFIVAEAPEWEVNQVVLARTDPLVIGVTKRSIYLLDQYDPTVPELEATEEYTLTL